MVSTWNVDVSHEVLHSPSPSQYGGKRSKHTSSRYSNDGDSNNQSEHVGAGDPWIGDGESTLA